MDPMVSFFLSSAYKLISSLMYDARAKIQASLQMAAYRHVRSPGTFPAAENQAYLYAVCKAALCGSPADLNLHISPPSWLTQGQRRPSASKSHQLALR